MRQGHGPTHRTETHDTDQRGHDTAMPQETAPQRDDTQQDRDDQPDLMDDRRGQQAAGSRHQCDQHRRRHTVHDAQARQSDRPAIQAGRMARSRGKGRCRGFYRMLDTMLFKAAEPDERYRVLERFYRLAPDLIGRFYAGQSTMADKARILTGRPPVPILRAISALRGKSGGRA